MWGQIASAAIGLGKMLFGAKQNSLANKVVVPAVNYTESPYAKDKLNLAKMLYGGRMPGAAQAEEGIFQNNANTTGAVARNATDGSQSLGAMIAAQAQTDDSLNNLRLQEGNYSLNMLNNLNNAEDTMTQELYKKYLDQVRTQQQKIDEKNALRGAAWQNIGGGANELSAVGGNYDLLKALKTK